MLAGVLAILVGGGAPAATAQVQVPPGIAADVVVTGIPRPLQLGLDASGRLVVLSHGWRGDAAAEIYRLDLTAGAPVDAARAPRIVLPFAEGPRKQAFGSMAIDPRSGDLFLGEENGNRVYRLVGGMRLATLAVGLYHLAGGSTLAFDGEGRLVVLDFASPEGYLRADPPPPPELRWLAAEGYQGPLVLGIDPAERLGLPRRLDMAPPLFPKAWGAEQAAREVLPRFISVAALPDGELALLSSLGEVFKLGPDGRLRLHARLPAGHYHRTHLAVASGGSLFVSSGFHVRQLFRVAPDGSLSVVARDLADPGGIAVHPSGVVYVAEAALHRIIRIRAVHGRLDTAPLPAVPGR